MTAGWSAYYSPEQVDAAVSEGGHRELVGGLWETIGQLQLNILIEHGLRTDHKLVDIGCGALRGGIHFIRYLDPAHYYGLDLRQTLLDAGYDLELTQLGLTDRLPREHLLADAKFNASRFDTSFDRAIAFSLFTHLPLDIIRTCLERLAPSMNPGGIFYATFFEAPEHLPTSADIVHHPGGIVTHAGADPFHHRVSDFVHLASGLPWDVVYIGDIGHPRNQKLISFVGRGSSGGPVDVKSRGLSVSDAASLAAGDSHYRAYVGPAERYDLIGASQFALLFQLGLRDRQRVLDFGCGSLRLGRLLIPYLQEGGYFGIDPNRWLIEDGIDRELGRSALGIKRPRFAYNEDFDCTVFGVDFDFIVAQSIVTHMGCDLVEKLFSSAKQALTSDGLFLFSYIKNETGSDLPADGWHYPGCIGYTDKQLDEKLKAAGMTGTALPWFHPGASWYMASSHPENFPPPERIAMLTGQLIR